MLLVQILNEEPPALRQLDARIPRDLETICLKCLEKDPSRRYSTAADLSSDLRRWLTGHPITARRVSRTERTWRWCKCNSTVATLSASVLLIGNANLWESLALRTPITRRDIRVETNLLSQRSSLGLTLAVMTGSLQNARHYYSSDRCSMIVAQMIRVSLRDFGLAGSMNRWPRADSHRMCFGPMASRRLRNGFRPLEMRVMTAEGQAAAAWHGAYPTATAATTAKNTARESLVAAIRSLVKVIQSKPSVSDESKQAIGITIADTTKTPVGVPTTAPTAMVEQTNRLQHTIHFADSTTPTSKAKPAGVRGAQVWVKVGTAPPASEGNPDFRSLEDFGSLHATTRARPTSPSSTPPTPAKPPITGSAGENTKGLYAYFSHPCLWGVGYCEKQPSR